jgi:uncharacterized protein (TIGR03663 family)
MLTLTLPFASSLGLRLLGWDPAALEGPSAWTRAGIVTATVFALAALCAWASPLAFPAWLRIAALFWAIVVVLFTTVLTNVRGLMTGVVGSLGYWQGQHQVARGSQPWFYYLMLGGLYEFLAWGLSAAGAVAWVRRRRPRFVGFVLWWAIASWVAYSAAGERMPWLLLNITVPMCLLGGWWLSRFVESIDWERLEWDRALPVLAALPMAVLAIFPLLGLHPFAGRELGSLATTGRWLGHLLAVVALAVFVARRARGLPRPLLARLTALGSIAFVGLLSARFSVMLNFVNFDMASEILVYAHATPDIKRALREIDEVAARTGAGRDLQVAYDDDSAWPFTWYLRVYPKQRFYGNSPTADALRSPVVIVGSKNAEAAAPYLTRDYVRRDYRLIWWPIEDYNQGLQGLVAAVRDPSSRRRLWQVVFHRHYPDVDLGQWPYRHEFKLYLRRDLVAQAWPLGLTALRSTLAESAAWAKVAEVDCAPLAVYAGPYGGLALKAPGAVAVAPDGARLIADTGNDRVVVLDRAGGFTSAFGSRCDLGQGPAGGCLDPDAAGPRALGDGQFREPWGIASGPAGEIVVADTWNGRVQALDRQGRFLWAWGHLGVGVPPPVPPDSLYGPRGIAFDVKRDRWLVSDTGNKRLLALRRDGAFLFEAGGPGAAPGRFEEPVGVAVDPRDGSLSVADTWNRRIQRLDAEMRPAADWPVPAWEGQDAFNKPYLAVGETGDVYASDPQNARVLLLDREGRLRLTLSAPSWRTGPRARPTGLALDERAHQLLIADTANDRVWVMPQVRSASSTCPP